MNYDSGRVWDEATVADFKLPSPYLPREIYEIRNV
jgi:hypothetical protein